MKEGRKEGRKERNRAMKRREEGNKGRPMVAIVPSSTNTIPRKTEKE